MVHDVADELQAAEAVLSSQVAHIPGVNVHVRSVGGELHGCWAAEETLDGRQAAEVVQVEHRRRSQREE